jgi:hypothetical protein
MWLTLVYGGGLYLLFCWATWYVPCKAAFVATDELWRSFLTYGVSGTPTFVLADAAGKVQSIASGYRPEVGLPLAGWSWTTRDPAPTQDSRP